MGRLRRLFGIALAVALLCGCEAGAARDPNTLVVLEAADASTLNPLYTTDAASFLDQTFIFEGLAGTGDSYEPIPWLATSWRSSRNHLRWTVNLRHDVRWSDGVPFTSRDVAWTWKIQLDPATGFPYRGQFDFIKSVRADGPYRVIFELSHPNALFELEALGASILPEHILGRIPAREQRFSSFAEHPVGTGPFLFQSWRHDEEMTFARNPHWWRGPVTIPRIAMRIELNDQARLDAMEENAADVYDGMGTSSYAILKQQSPSLKLLHLPDLFSFFIFTNLTRPGLDDVAVRRAMLYGWDREGVANGLLQHDALVATGVVPVALDRWYDPNVRQYPFQPERAQAILEAAGWHVGPDGVRVRGHERLAFDLLLGGADAALGDIAAEFQADMRSIGVAIAVRTLDYSTFLQVTTDRHYDLALSGWGGTPDPDQFTLLESKQIPPEGNNLMSYSNPIVDHDVTAGLQTFAYKSRKALYDQMQAVTAEDLPVLFFENTYYRAALSSRVHLPPAKILPDQYLFRNVFAWTLDK